MFSVGFSLSWVWLSEEFSLSWESNSVMFPFYFLVLVVSGFIMVYSKYYMSHEMNFSSYLCLMLVFVGSMIFLLTSGSFITLLLGWEGLGVSSFFLILYYNTWESQMNSLVTLMTMRLGELWFFIFLSSLLLENSMGYCSVYYSSSFYFSLLAFGMTKSAQYPYSGWLPKAMSAPTPTSALVHSSTLVTAGLVVMLVFSECVSSPLLMAMLSTIGLFTMLVGSLLATVESSIKKVVAYSTLSQMGMATMVFGLGNFYAAFLNLVSHGLAKSLLFLQVGFLIHTSYEQQNIREYCGKSTASGLMQVQIVCSLFSLNGLMFMGGMITKESILELVSSLSLQWAILLMVKVCVFLTLFYSLLVYCSLFNQSAIPCSDHSPSVVLLMTTYLEVFLVVCFSSWSSSNMLSVPIVFSYFESAFPLIFTLVVGVALWVSWAPHGPSSLFSLQLFGMTHQIYGWSTNVPQFKFLETGMGALVMWLLGSLHLAFQKFYVTFSLNQTFLVVFLSVLMVA